jgi:dTDP-4-dehydrorhamnose 3,5-epimerase
MEIVPLAGPDGPLLLRPRRHADARGWFEETWRAQGLPAFVPVQENVSHSIAVRTLRGLHFQRPPHAQAKLLSVDAGRIEDLMVDLRPGPGFGQVTRLHLDPVAGSIFVPKGFAHGFVTLEPDTRVRYRVNHPYAPESEGGLAWDDPALALMDLGPAEALEINARDRQWPRLHQLGQVFA